MEVKPYPQIVYRDGHQSEYKKVHSLEEHVAILKEWGKEVPKSYLKALEGEPEEKPEPPKAEEPQQVEEVYQEPEEEPQEEEPDSDQKEEDQVEEEEDDEAYTDEELSSMTVKDLKEILEEELEVDSGELKGKKKAELVKMILKIEAEG